MSAPAGSWRSPPPPGSGSLTAWNSLSGPAGLSPDIVASANREVVEALERPQVKRQIEQDAIEVTAMSPNEVTRFMQSEIDRWTPMITRLVGAK